MKQARAAVAVAQRVSTLVAVESLCDALDVGLAAPRDPALVQRLLSSLDATALSLLQTMLDTLAGSLDNEARFGLWGSRAAQLVERVCESHDLLLHHHRGDIEPALLASAADWAARRALLRRLAGDAPEDPPWRILLVCLRPRGAAVLPDIPSLHANLRHTISVLLLINMFVQREPQPAACFALLSCVDELARLLPLSSGFTRNTPCALLVDSHGLPQRLEGWQMPSEDGASLFCGFHALLQDLDTRIHELEAVQVLSPPPPPPMPESPAPKAGERPVQGAVKPTAKPAAASVPAPVEPPVVTPAALLDALQLLRAAMMIAQPPAVRQSVPELRTLASFDFMRIRVLLSNPIKSPPKREVLIREVEVLDVTAEGGEFLIESDSESARLNGLLALHTGGEWWIFVIRRLLMEADGRQFAGARLLDRNPVAARFLQLHDGGRNVLGHVIYLPDQRPDKARLLVAQMQLDVGGVYVLDMERRERPVQIDRVIDAGSGFVLLAVTFSNECATVDGRIA